MQVGDWRLPKEQEQEKEQAKSGTIGEMDLDQIFEYILDEEVEAIVPDLAAFDALRV
jgi:hypothetical protein